MVINIITCQRKQFASASPAQPSPAQASWRHYVPTYPFLSFISLSTDIEHLEQIAIDFERILDDTCGRGA